MILTMRTDRPEAELYLLSPAGSVQAKLHWHADRKLADELLPKVQELLASNNLQLEDLTGIGIFTGEGSFTGLRIGTTVANALAYSLSIPIVSGAGEDWQNDVVQKLMSGQNEHIVVPRYDRPANITKPQN